MWRVPPSQLSLKPEMLQQRCTRFLCIFTYLPKEEGPGRLLLPHCTDRGNWGTGPIISQEEKFLFNFGELLIPEGVPVPSAGVPNTTEFWQSFREWRWREDGPFLPVAPIPLTRRHVSHLFPRSFLAPLQQLSTLPTPAPRPCFPKAFQEPPYAGPLPSLS